MDANENNGLSPGGGFVVTPAAEWWMTGNQL
jgi:hypothetical protein